MATMAMTELTPMTMPSMVKPERTKFAESAEYVFFKNIFVFILFQMFDLPFRVTFAVADNQSVANMNDAVGVFGDVRLVCN